VKHSVEHQAIDQDQIAQLSENIQLSDLSEKDQSLAKNLYEEYSNDLDKLNLAFMKAAKSNMFDDPNKVLALLQRQNDVGGILN
jgi:hypothetical protein